MYICICMCMYVYMYRYIFIYVCKYINISSYNGFVPKRFVCSDVILEINYLDFVFLHKINAEAAFLVWNK